MLISCFKDKNFLFSHIVPFEVEWQWQNPLPQENPLFASHIFNSQKAIVFGNVGTVLQTGNGVNT